MATKMNKREKQQNWEEKAQTQQWHTAAGYETRRHKQKKTKTIKNPQVRLFVNLGTTSTASLYYALIRAPRGAKGRRVDMGGLNWENRIKMQKSGKNATRHFGAP